MAFEQTGDSISVAVKGSAKIVAGTGMVQDTDGTFIANNVTQGPIDGVLLYDVTPAAGTLAGAVTGSIGVPNGCIRKVLLGATCAVNDGLAFDNAGKAIVYVNSADQRCMGKFVLGGATGNVGAAIFRETLPLAWTA